MASTSDHAIELLIGGESVAGAGAPLAVENPYTTESIASVASASGEQIDAAVAAARAAWPLPGVRGGVNASALSAR